MRRVGAVVTARAVTTPAALVAIAHNLAGIKGRKSLIWISSAFPAFVDWRSGGPPASNRGTTLRIYFNNDITAATRALTDANVAVYPVDPRGLPAPCDRAYWKLDPRYRRDFGGFAGDDYATMDTVADLTGGKASYHTNDIEGSIRRAIDDSRVTYMLGYYPDHNAVGWRIPRN